MTKVLDPGNKVPKIKPISTPQADPWMFPIPGLVQKPTATTAPTSTPQPSAPSANPNVPGPAGKITVGTPDWLAIIKGDPGYIAGHAGIESKKDAALAARQGNIRSMLVRLGYLPPGFTDKYGDIDPATLTAASENPNSTKALLERLYQENMTRLSNTDEARGIFHESGAYQQGANMEGVAAGARTQQAIDEFLSAVAGEGTTYANALGQAGTEEGNLVTSVGTKVQNDPSIAAGYEATLVPNSTTTYGQAIYKGPDGKLYTADGKVFDPNAHQVVVPPGQQINQITQGAVGYDPYQYDGIF